MEMLLEKLIKATRTYLNNDQPPEEKSMAVLLAEERILKAMQTLEEKPESMQELLLQFSKDLQTLDENSNQLKQEEQAAKIISKLPLSVAITPDLPIMDSLIMEDEHFNTIPEIKSNEENESSVKDLNLTPSESEDLSDNESKCDMPVGDDSSSKNEDLDDIVSISSGKEIDHLDTIPNLVKSLLNRANSINFLIEEFTGKLTPIDQIPPGIVEADPEEDIRLIEKLLNDDSFPHSSEELNSEIPDAIIESFSPSTIPVEDSDSLMEEIDIFLAPNDSIPPGIKNDDYDSEGGVLFLVELLNNDSLSLTEYESFHVDFYNVPSSPRLPEKPPDDDGYSDNSTRELYVHVPNVLPTLPTLYPVFDTLLPFLSKNEDKVFNPEILISKEEKSPHILSHQGFKVFQLINDSESPTMINGGDIPILDVPYLHLYPP
ncbi:hypothetical protein Tco_0190523 [Tanacetum coccineum]